MSKKNIDLTIFNEKIVPITAPAVVTESGAFVTLVGGKAYFFDENGREVYVSKELKLAYKFENTFIFQSVKGELFHLVTKEQPQPKQVLKLKNIESPIDEEY